MARLGSLPADGPQRTSPAVGSSPAPAEDQPPVTSSCISGAAAAGGAVPDGSSPPCIPDHELLALIGQGGYGQVWLARNAMGTLRAVKLLEHDHFDDPTHFEREFKGLQKFEPVSRTHEGLVDILQIGRHDERGYFYYVMEVADRIEMAHGSGPAAYVPCTLRGELEQHRRLPLDRCIAIGLAISDALAHLHRQGLVHRDIKPSNIILIGGQPKLADIGLVTDVGEARSLVGTVGYIPPEGPGTPQADLYSLGKVLYELSTGSDRQRFPQWPTDVRTGVDHARWLEWNEVLLRACESNARQRYASAAALHADLERLARGESVRGHHRIERTRVWALKAAAAAVGVGAFALVLMPQFGRQLATAPGPAAAAKASVFVLPFRAEPRTYGYWGGDPLANRLTDALIDGLGVIEGVRVGPRKSGWVTEDEAVLRERVRRDFGARQVVSGRTRSDTNGLEVTVEVWDAPADHARYGERFHGQTDDLLELERQVVQAVSRELGLKTTAAEQSAVENLLTRNVEAWKHLKQGLAGQASGTSAGLAAAIQACYRALELDPVCLDARTSLITAYRGLSSDRPAREVWPQVCDLARRALEIDDTSYWARYWLAGSKLQHYFLWEEGIREIEALLPPEDHLSRAHLYRILGRFASARLEQDKLESDRPRLEQMNLGNPAVSFHSLQARFVERRYADGIREAHRWTAVQPESTGPYWPLTRLATESGDYATALAAVRNLRRVDDTPAYLAVEGRCLALMGDRDKALEVVNQLEAESRTRYVNPYWVAWVHAGLRDTAKALECLERAVGDRAEEIVNVDWGGLRTDPAWDDFRDDPRFLALLKQVGLDVWPK